MKQDNFIKQTFLRLTNKTYPYGFEDDFVIEMKQLGILPQNLNRDSQGNYFLKIGESRTVFASHFDTACKSQTAVNHVIDGNMIRTDKTSILGADDKAGVTIMLWLIKNEIPGNYYFFIGEEVGCIGSGLAAKSGEFTGLYDRIISFDRKGTTSVITHQSYTRTCSDEFAKELAKQLNKYDLEYKIDDTGVYTDSAEFTSVIPECTNLSVGYYQEHTTNEHQDITHLQKLANACLFVDWENLPTKRDMTKEESLWDYKYPSSKDYTKNWSDGYTRSAYDYGQCHDDYEYVSNNHRVRDRHKKSKNYWKKESTGTGRKYYDWGGELLDFQSGTKDYAILNTHYDFHKEKFISPLLTASEIETIKNQYLDMNHPEDKKLYESIKLSLTF
jgi:hypothetical protein